MGLDPDEPYWVDELDRKHEAYRYGDSRAQAVTVEHEGRALQVLMPEYAPPTTLKVTASAGDFLFLLGETVDKEEEDGETIEGGEGVMMAARKHPERDGTYYVFVWHNLYPKTLRCLEG